MSMLNGEIVIDLAALQENWRKLNGMFAGEVGAVVKANAYGLGVKPVVESLAKAGCNTFFVSNLSEAIDVRAFVSTASIFVFSGVGSGEHLAFQEHDISPVIVSYAMACKWFEFEFSARPACAIKIDTGMGRYGLNEDELCQLCQQHPLNDLGVTALMSHFANAEDPEHEKNIYQLKMFSRSYSALKRFVPHVVASFCNSSAIFHFPQAHFELARPGYALYGGNPTPYKQNPMLPVISVRLPVTQVKTLQVGDCVGYGSEFTASKQMEVATVYGGYADGVFRAGQRSLFLSFRGYALAVVGRVSMDSLVVDLSSVPSDERPSLGDSVEFIGGKNSIERVALMCQTNGYEILTSLSSRFRRCYWGGR